MMKIIMKFNDILHKLCAESFTQKDKGTQFERLMRSWLLFVPRYSNLTDVWLLEDFQTCFSLSSTSPCRLWILSNHFLNSTSNVEMFMKKLPLITPELVITLQQLEGIGNKTILTKIGDKITSPIQSISELSSFWKTLKGKKFESITSSELIEANKIAKRIIKKAEDEGVGIITYYDTEYPEILRNCSDEQGKLDPPLVLYYRGNIKALEMPGLAVIGTREPTPNGIKAGEFFAGEFAKKGFNIVSGLAIGCDTTGHKGALEANGVTTAFLANGLDWESIYPKENLHLAQDIVRNGGLLLSEYPIGQTCGRYGLVARDRLQAGLAKATIVVQTGVKGGTMHAVNATIAANKPLFAVEYRNPVDTCHEKVQGNIMLIQDKGAYALKSTNLDDAIAIIEGNNKHTPKVSQKSLFD